MQLIRLCIASASCQWAAVMCAMAHYVTYTGDGVGIPAVKSLGEFCAAAGRVVLMLAALLAAQGLSEPVSTRGRWAFAVAAAALALLYTAFIVWDLADRNPMTTSLALDGAAGQAVCGLTIACAVWLAALLVNSYLRESKAAAANAASSLVGAGGAAGSGQPGFASSAATASAASSSSASSSADPARARLFISVGVPMFVWFIWEPIVVLSSPSLSPVVAAKVVDGLIAASNACAFAFVVSTAPLSRPPRSLNHLCCAVLR
jgi:hypothetical protein